MYSEYGHPIPTDEDGNIHPLAYVFAAAAVVITGVMAYNAYQDEHTDAPPEQGYSEVDQTQHHQDSPAVIPP